MSFFSSIIKQKKATAFLLLFFLSIGVLIPFITHAQAAPTSWLDTLQGVATGTLTLADAGKNLTVLMGQGIVSMAMGLASISRSLFESVINSQSVQESITSGNGKNAQVVIKGWTVIRDFSNMFIVLGFVVIGIATILRIGEYSFQKLLPKLIIAALLINFSLLICGIVIDGTNIAMNYFLNPAQGNAVGANGIAIPIGGAAMNQQISDNINNEVKNPNTFEVSNFFATIVGASLFAFIAAILFFMYAFLFIFRQVALMCLVVLSPLAFVCAVFPATKTIWDKWKTEFLKWAIVGIPALFFMWLGQMVAISSLGDRGDVAGSALSFFVPAAFMYFAYTLSISISAIGAGGAIGLASGAMGYAMGASRAGGGYLAGLAGRATGVTNAAASVKSGALRLGEFVGVTKRGSAAQYNLQRLDDSKKRLDNLKSDELTKIATQRGFSKTRSEDKAAAIRLLADRGDLGKIKDKGKLEAAVAHAESYGVQRKEFTKADPTLAKADPEKIKTYMAAGQTKTQATRNATNDAQAVAYRNADIDTLGKMGADRFNMDLVLNISSKKLGKLGERLSTDRINQLKRLTTPGGELETRINALAAGSADRVALEKKRDEINSMYV